MIQIIDYTVRPLNLIGIVAATCYNTELKDAEHAMRIAKHCIKSDHGRNLEFGDFTAIIDENSARMIRELFRHHEGTSFLQSSTRYITYKEFDYYTPKGMNEAQEATYHDVMKAIQEGYGKLKELGLENDITGYVLPLGMTSKFVVKINIRALQHLSNMRMCTRALAEFRKFMIELKQEVSKLNDEWKWIADNLMVAKCDRFGFCTEGKMTCGRKSLLE